MTKVKICGLQRVEDVDYVNEVTPDYVGFVFAESKRKITKENAKKLRELLDKRIDVVGVFVNETVENITEIVAENIVDIVQLHGDEDKAYIANLKKLIPSIPIIKAIRVSVDVDIRKTENMDVNYFLFDTYTSDQYGGSGKCFDWKLLSNVSKPYFLAGGLTADNVQIAINMCNPYAVDVSSYVETEGYKDKEKLERFVMRVRT